jgi:hypothetical protein
VGAKTGAGGGGGGGLNKNQKKKQRKKKSKAAAKTGTPDGNGNSQSSDGDAGTSSSLDPGQVQLKRLLDSNGLAKHAQQFCVERRMTVEMLKQYGKSDLEGMGLSEKDASVLMQALWKAPDPVDPAKMVEDYCKMVVMDGTHGGDLELAALAQLLNRKIYVYQEEVKANENQSEDKVTPCIPSNT